MSLKTFGIGLSFAVLFVGCKSIKQDIIYGDPTSFETTTPVTLSYNDIVEGNYKTNTNNYLEDKVEYKNVTIKKTVPLIKVVPKEKMVQKEIKIPKKIKQYSSTLSSVKENIFKPKVKGIFKKNRIKKIEKKKMSIEVDNKSDNIIKKSIFSLIKSIKELQKKSDTQERQLNLYSTTKQIDKKTQNNDAFTNKLMQIIDGMHQKINDLEMKVDSVKVSGVSENFDGVAQYKLEEVNQKVADLSKKNDQVNLGLIKKIKSLNNTVEELKKKSNIVTAKVDLTLVNSKIDEFESNIQMLKKDLAKVSKNIARFQNTPGYTQAPVEYNNVQPQNNYSNNSFSNNSTQDIVSNIQNKFANEDGRKVSSPTQHFNGQIKQNSNYNQPQDDIFATFENVRENIYKALKNIKVYAFSNDKNYLIDEIRAGETFRLEDCRDCTNMLFRKIEGIEGYIKNR